MEYAQIVQKLAACGLDCSRCADYQNGEIKELSTKLLDLLEGYDRLVKIKSKLDPAFKGIINSKRYWMYLLMLHVVVAGVRM